MVRLPPKLRRQSVNFAVGGWPIEREAHAALKTARQVDKNESLDKNKQNESVKRSIKIASSSVPNLHFASL
jgi:hypothetical protein